MAEALRQMPEGEPEEEKAEEAPRSHSEGPEQLGGISGRDRRGLELLKGRLEERERDEAVRKAERDDAEITRFQSDVKTGIERIQEIQKVEADLAKAETLLRRIDAGEEIKRHGTNEPIPREEVESSIRINKEKLRKLGWDA
ncbi:hypothetical protein L0Y40_03060 [Candidatus Wolfebacteria bacterium]|nr:hypothetical protein [Candidatus Wolfebacteria bacterium]